MTVDSALYPVLFTDYLQRMTGPLDTIWLHFIHLTIVLVIGYINYKGIELVGVSSIIFGVLCMSPFIALCLMGMTYIHDPSIWSQLPHSFVESDWSVFLSVLLWNYIGFDQLGTIAGEVYDPSRTFPRGMVITSVLLCFVYAPPVMVGLQFLPDFDSWYEGMFPNIAKQIGGEFLLLWLTMIVD